jgi:chemotaxis signal transduction protein
MPAWMIGIMAWRGETIAVVDLDCYLSDKPGISSLSATNAMLLVAKQQNHTFGLLIPAIGFTSTIELEQVTPLSALTNFTFAEKNEVIEGAFSDIPILSIPALLTMLVQQIGMTTYHG